MADDGIDENVFAAQCVEHAEALEEKQAEMMRVANAALKKLNIKTGNKWTCVDPGNFHYDECPIYKSVKAFPENLENALNPNKNKIREFYDKDVIAKLEQRITCPICLQNQTKWGSKAE